MPAMRPDRSANGIWAPRLQFHPLKRGFKEQFGFIGGGHDYFKAETDNPNAREYMTPIERDGKPVVETEYLTDAFSREACSFVRRHDKEPFFLYLAYNSPHTPLQAPKDYLERVSSIQDPIRRSYAAMICAMDDGIGRLAATLEVLKLENDTLIFFLSDNGGPTPVTHADNHPYPRREGRSLRRRNPRSLRDEVEGTSPRRRDLRIADHLVRYPSHRGRTGRGQAPHRPSDRRRESDASSYRQGFPAAARQALLAHWRREGVRGPSGELETGQDRQPD